MSGVLLEVVSESFIERDEPTLSGTGLGIYLMCSN